MLLALSIIGCDSRFKDDELIRNALQGEWESFYIHSLVGNNYLMDKPYGISFAKDSAEIFNGFYSSKKDTIDGGYVVKYHGNFTKYRVNGGRIYIKNPVEGKWVYYWKFIRRSKDTLFFETSDSAIEKFRRLSYGNLDTVADFDKIIYSSTGCYGRCPIMDIIVDKEGRVLFQGEGFVNKLGFYKGQLNKKQIQYLFEKFKKANPVNLLNEYSRTIDDQNVITTFVKNGRIIKTIDCSINDSPSALFWAYVPISNIYSQMDLQKLPFDEPFYPKMHYYSFMKNGLILPLNKSESFYFWTELRKGKVVNKDFVPKYTMSFTGNYTYFGPDPNKKRAHKYILSVIKTDGRHYRFEFKNARPLTYDMGYDFLHRNFKESDFRKPESWEVD